MIKSKARVIFRADGNSQIGLGHVVRSLALADMIRDEYECYFAIQNPSQALKLQISAVCTEIIILKEAGAEDKGFIHELDAYLSGNEIIVLDGYKFGPKYQQAVKHKGCTLICIDDIHSYHFVADAIINHAGGISIEKYSCSKDSQIYLGLDYALLRQPFLQVASQERYTLSNSIFICIGGADPYNITLKVLQAALVAKDWETVNVVVGSAYPHNDELTAFLSSTKANIQLLQNIHAERMVEIMLGSGVAICPASSVAFEVFCVGLNLLTGYFVDNQREFSDYINEQGLGYSVGDMNKASQADLVKAIKIAYSSNHYKLQKAAMDGMQKYRYLNLFSKVYDKRHSVDRAD
jgi:UDP-2,4-diacetamido-2,4,6-trideoxy-beta-L-altropyranose hydrolase